MLEDDEAERDQRDSGLTATSLLPVAARYRFVDGRYQPSGPDACQ